MNFTYASHLSQMGEIIVCGDLNARTGKINDIIHQDINMHIPLPDCYTCDLSINNRMNQDKVIDYREKQVMDTCISTQMSVLNGCLLGDWEGCFICHKFNGASTNDYMIGSQALISLIHTFMVV